MMRSRSDPDELILAVRRVEILSGPTGEPATTPHFRWGEKYATQLVPLMSK